MTWGWLTPTVDRPVREASNASLPLLNGVHHVVVHLLGVREEVHFLYLCSSYPTSLLQVATRDGPEPLPFRIFRWLLENISSGFATTNNVSADANLW